MKDYTKVSNAEVVWDLVIICVGIRALLYLLH